MNRINTIAVRGQLVDDNTRCSHYHSTLDIIAIKFKCCHEYYACYYCHEALASHAPVVWQKTEFNEKAILCGTCYNEMTISEYKNANYQCPDCGALFNPKCVNHNHLYFEQ